MERIFNIWPTMADFARDIGESAITVRHWKRRGSIPGTKDSKIVAAAASRGETVTYEELALLRSPESDRGAAA